MTLPAHTISLTRNRALIAASRGLLMQTRSRIASCRRLLNTAWEIAGGSDGDLRVAVRERLARGLLVPAPSRFWPRKGTGHTCMICGQAISSSQIENELVNDTVPISVHLDCYSIWNDESLTFTHITTPDERDSLAVLCSLVRDGIAHGAIFPLASTKSWSGRGLSGACAVCRKPIFASEPAHEVIGGVLGETAYAHPTCFRAWLVESRAYRRPH